MHILENELEQRWQAMFEALANGDDVPPSERLRTEGMMEAVVLLGATTAEELLQSMNRCYRDAFDEGIAATFGDDWQELFPFPQIPAMAGRAPVYPSTPQS
jgi:hypothetical protein